MQTAKRSDSTARTVLGLMLEVARVIRQQSGGKGSFLLPLACLETLRFVHAEGEPTMHDIAKHLRVTAPTATGVVAPLIAKGYAIRKSDARDKRVTKLRLSPKGKSLLAEAMAERTAAMEGLLKGIGRRDQGEFIRILSKLIHAS